MDDASLTRGISQGSARAHTREGSAQFLFIFNANRSHRPASYSEGACKPRVQQCTYGIVLKPFHSWNDNFKQLSLLGNNYIHEVPIVLYLQWLTTLYFCYWTVYQFRLLPIIVSPNNLTISIESEANDLYHRPCLITDHFLKHIYLHFFTELWQSGYN